MDDKPTGPQGPASRPPNTVSHGGVVRHYSREKVVLQQRFAVYFGERIAAKARIQPQM
jgi:hypothetical protein